MVRVMAFPTLDHSLTSWVRKSSPELTVLQKREARKVGVGETLEKREAWDRLMGEKPV